MIQSITCRVRCTCTRLCFRYLATYAETAGCWHPPGICIQNTATAGELNDHRGRLLRLILSTTNVSDSLQNWVDEGRMISGPNMREVVRRLKKLKRYELAMELLTWMKDQNGFHFAPDDHVMSMELLIRLHGSKEAEVYLANASSTLLKKSMSLPLLHAYVIERNTEKAEHLMLKMEKTGLNVTPHSYNEMMKLYMETSQFLKMPAVILKMKRNKIPRNVLSYNLWMRASYEISGIDSAKMVIKEMVSDKNVELGWSSLCTLSIIYQKSGLVDKAVKALKNAERKLSDRNRLAYFFLITLYTSLRNTEGVLRIWERSKKVEGRTTCVNYMTMILSLVKLGEVVRAERVFMEWEMSCYRYDIRVPNILLGAYMRSGLMDKVEALLTHTLRNGGCPNGKTRDILMEGWIRKKEVGKAVSALKNGFSYIESLLGSEKGDLLCSVK